MVDVKIGDLDENDSEYCIGTVAGYVYGLISKCYSSVKIVCHKVTDDYYSNKVRWDCRKLYIWIWRL